MKQGIQGTVGMGMNFTSQENAALYGMLAESAKDIILKTDASGMVVHASSGVSQLGSRVIGPNTHFHLTDLIAPEAVADVMRVHARALKSKGIERVEFPAVTRDQRQRWFEVSMRGLHDEGQLSETDAYGVLCIMRDVDELRALNERLFKATYTDPLTGLMNRQAFVSMLDHMIASQKGGCISMFSIDFFRAINVQHGQNAGDDVLMTFGDLLREILRSDDIIARIGSEQFAVILPRITTTEAEGICTRVVTTLAQQKHKIGNSHFDMTVSASVARIEGSLDTTIKRAEMALFAAKSKGHNRLEMAK